MRWLFRVTPLGLLVGLAGLFLATRVGHLEEDWGLMLIMGSLAIRFASGQLHCLSRCGFCVSDSTPLDFEPPFYRTSIVAELLMALGVTLTSCFALCLILREIFSSYARCCLTLG